MTLQRMIVTACLWCNPHPLPLLTGGDVSLTLRGTHGLLHTVQISVDQSLYAYLDEHWPFPSHQPTDLAALHAVSAPPSYVRPESEQIFLVELSSDRFDQVHPDDVLLLLTVRYFVSGSAWTSDKVKTRVLWGPKKATREQALQFLRMQWHCRSEATTCELLFNEVVWAIHDTALYNFESGDHLRLNIKSTRDNWCEFTFSEQADRERRVLESSPSSPPVEQGGPESEEADLSPYTIQNQQLSRSRSRSLLQSTTQIVPKNSQSPGAPFLQCRPNADITDMMDFDDYIPYDRQFSQWRPLQRKGRCTLSMVWPPIFPSCEWPWGSSPRPTPSSLCQLQNLVCDSHRASSSPTPRPHHSCPTPDPHCRTG